MKKLIFLAGLLITTLTVTAQESLSVLSGPFISYKAGISGVDTPEGRQNAIAFNNIPDFGLSTYVPISESGKLGAWLDLSYANYSYGIKNYHSGDKYNQRHSYFVFAPYFYFNGLMFGFAFGQPLSANNDGVEIDEGAMNFMAEVRIGGTIPIFEDESGALMLFIMGGYMLSGVYDNFPKDDPMKSIIPAQGEQVITHAFNPRVASVAIGFNYLFDIKF